MNFDDKMMEQIEGHSTEKKDSENVSEQIVGKMSKSIQEELRRGLYKARMRPFDINLAREGALICTKNGMPARIVCFNRKPHPDMKDENCTMVVLVDNGLYEEILTYTITGKLNPYVSGENDYDLMMLPRQLQGWVNLYRDKYGVLTGEAVYSTKELAEIHSKDVAIKYIATVPINWEE